MEVRTQWTHSDVWSQLATTPEWSFKIGDRQNEKKRWNPDQRAIWNATCWIDAGRGVIRHWGVSDSSDGARPLWRSHSAGTEIFFADAELTASTWLILQTVQTNALVNNGGFPLRAAINWSRRSLGTPAGCYIICWRPCTSIQLHLHPITSCFLFLLHLVLGTIVNCESRVILSGAAFAALRWTKWCLHCGWVSAGGVLDEVPVVLLNSVSLLPCRDLCGAMICGSGIEEMMITKQSGKSWGRRYWKEVGCPEEYIVSLKSKCHAEQPTCLFYTRWILLRIAAHCTVSQPSCDLHQVSPILCDCLLGLITLNDRQNLRFVRYKQYILQQKGRLLMFVSRSPWDLTCNRR